MISPQPVAGSRTWIWASAALVGVISLIVLGALLPVWKSMSVGTLVPFLFALVVLGVYMYGAWYSLRILREHQAERQELERCAGGIRAVAEAFVTGAVGNGADLLRRVDLEFAKQPLLRRHLSDAVGSVLRGAPLLNTDLVHTEERHFPGAERALRSMMDIVLNLGIAGTFLSLVLTFRSQSGTAITPDTLLEHIGPGLVSGLMAVIANVGLRLCYGAVLTDQERLAEAVGSAVAEHFVVALPRRITSPEERLAQAVAQHLGLQTERLNELLTRQLQAPIGAIRDQAAALAVHAGSLARSSETWADVARDVKSAQSRLLDAQTDGLQRHAEQIAGLVEHQRQALDAFFTAAQKSQTSSEERLSGRFVELQAQCVRATEDALRLQGEAVRDQAAAFSEGARTLLDTAVRELERVVAERVGAVEQHVATTMGGLQSSLPEAMRAGMAASLGEATNLIHQSCDRAGDLAHAINQTRQNADRHQQALDDWFERTRIWQDRLERILEESDDRQRQFHAQWREHSAVALNRLEADLQTHRESLHQDQATLRNAVGQLAGGFGALEASLSKVREPVIHLTQPVTDLSGGITELHGEIKVLRETVVATNEPAVQLSTSVSRLGEASGHLAEGLRASVDGANGALQQLRAAAEDTRRLFEEMDRDEEARAARLRTQSAATEAALRQMELASNRYNETISRAEALLAELLRDRASRDADTTANGRHEEPNQGAPDSAEKHEEAVGVAG